MSFSLLDLEGAADAQYGFPSGTMQALGTSESSNGTNLGSLGNIFQVTPSTAAQPGYGLSSVDGNSPSSVGAYLSALLNGPAGGNMASAMSLYQTGYANPNYSGNAAMSSFLGSLPGATATASTPASAPTTSTSGTPASTSTSTAASPSSWLSSLSSWAAQYAGRGALILLAVILLLGGVYLFATRTQAVSSET